MTDTERRFREMGWRRSRSDRVKWLHPKHGVLFLDPDIRDELIDMWRMGYDAGREVDDD